MPALIDTLPLGRLRARLGRWMWLLGALAGAGASTLRGPGGPGQAAALACVGALLGFGLGGLIVSTVRCRACGHRLLWEHFDDDTGLVDDPLEESACARCGAG